MIEIGPGMFSQRSQTCQFCKATGILGDISQACTTCKGKKVVSNINSLDVSLPIGCINSQKVMIDGQGDWIQSENKFGQLQVVVSILEHDFYELRGGYDLIINDTIDVF